MAHTTLAGREFESVAFSEIGGMPRNEDSLIGPIRSTDNRLVLWAVADGLGGQGAGDQASRAAIRACEAALHASSGYPLPAVCSKIINAAHEAVVALRGSSAETARAASTLTLLVTDGASVALGHVGDSRAYRFRRGECTQLSADQSVAATLVTAGMQQGDVRHSPDRSQLVSVLGGTLAPQVSEREALHRGDTFLLCTDGVWEPVVESRMQFFLDEADIDLFASRLRQAAGAVTSGHQDNFSAIAIAVTNEPTRVVKPPGGVTWKPVWNGLAAALTAVATMLAFAAGMGVGRWTAKPPPPSTTVNPKPPAPLPPANAPASPPTPRHASRAPAAGAAASNPSAAASVKPDTPKPSSPERGERLTTGTLPAPAPGGADPDIDTASAAAGETSVPERADPASATPSKGKPPAGKASEANTRKK